jgi:hypothetical protein
MVFNPKQIQDFFPEGLAGQIIKQLGGSTEGSVGLLVRSETLTAIDFLQRSLDNGFQEPYLFLGNKILFFLT